MQDQDHAFGRLLVGLLVVFTSALLSTPARAQQVFTGMVIDAGTGSAIAGAEVEISGGALQSPLRARSDAAGRYVIVSIPPGRYQLRVDIDGYFEYVTTLRVRPRQSAVPPVRLTAQVRVHQQVTVEAPAVLAARDYSSGIGVTPEQLLELPMSQTTNFSAVIPALTASAVTSHDNLVHLRGNELSLQMSVDGISFLDNTHQQFSPALSPDVFDSVELMTGGFSPEFGSRFGGILDLQTRSGFSQRGHGSVSIGGGSLSRGNLAAQWGSRSGHWGYFFSAAGSTSDRFLNPPQPQSFNNRGSSGQAMVRIDYRRQGRDAIRLVVNGGASDFDIPNTRRQQALGRDAFKATSQETLTASWDHDFGPLTLLSVSAYQRFTRERSHPTSDPRTILASGRRHDGTLGAKADLSTVQGGHVVKAGIDGKALDLDERMRIVDRALDEVSGGGKGPLLRSSGGSELDELDFVAQRTGSLLSAYIQDEWQPTAGVVANFGVRVDRFEMVLSQTEVSPRVNLAYEGHTGLRVHAAYNRFFAPPPIEYLLLSSLGAPAGTDASPVAAMTANQVEAGVGYRLGRDLTLDATGYYRRSDNAFETGELADTRVFVPVTFSHDESRGLEINLRSQQIGNSGLSGFVGYTFGKTEFIGPLSGGLADEEVAPGERLFPAFDQRHTVAASLHWRHSQSPLWIGIHAAYGSGTPIESENGGTASLRRTDSGGGGVVFERLASHFVVDLAAGYEFRLPGTHRISVDAHIENFTDDPRPVAKESTLTPIQYGQPRAFAVRARLVF